MKNLRIGYLKVYFSIGDMAFQAKCMARIRPFQREDKTLLFTSHNLISKMLQLTQKIVVPAGIAGTQSPWKGLQTLHPCNLDTGDPCRYDGLAEAAC